MEILTGTKRQINVKLWKEQLEKGIKRVNDSMECIRRFEGADDLEHLIEDCEKLAEIAKQAKKACIITACVAAPFGLFTAMLGMASRVMYENGTILEGTEVGVAAKSALPEFMMNMDKVVPSFSPAVAGILGGLVLASILAAILSTVSPIILAAGTMVTRDVYQRVLHPEATDEQVLKMGRVTTAIAGVICCVGAMAIWKLSTVLELVYAAYSLRGALHHRASRYLLEEVEPEGRYHRYDPYSYRSHRLGRR